MENYENAKDIEENKKSPKNKFLGLFCHASEVNTSWGFNWPFSCGVIVFSILIGLMTILDITAIFTKFFNNVKGWFLFWFVVRFFSDLIALLAIVFAILSIVQTNFTNATIAYYELILSFICNTLFCGYCIFRIFDGEFWKITTYRLVIWLLNEFIIFIFCWIFFCNMVDIGRKIKVNEAADNLY